MLIFQLLFLGVCDGEEGGVGVDAHRLVPAQPVHDQVQLDVVHQRTLVTEQQKTIRTTFDNQSLLTLAYISAPSKLNNKKTNLDLFWTNKFY